VSFKIPFFNPSLDIQSFNVWFTELFARWSTTDLLPTIQLSIQGWDMDTDAQKTVQYPQDFNFNRIRGSSVVIIKDDSSIITDASLVEDGLSLVEFNQTQIVLNRKSAGFFDSSNYDDSTINRGFVVLWMEV